MHFLIKILEFKVHSTLNCTILILLVFLRKTNNIKDSRNEKCIAFLICTILIFRISKNILQRGLF